jgi:hypothetical protein
VSVRSVFWGTVTIRSCSRDEICSSHTFTFRRHCSYAGGRQRRDEGAGRCSTMPGVVDHVLEPRGWLHGTLQGPWHGRCVHRHVAGPQFRCQGVPAAITATGESFGGGHVRTREGDRARRSGNARAGGLEQQGPARLGSTRTTTVCQLASCPVGTVILLT